MEIGPIRIGISCTQFFSFTKCYQSHRIKLLFIFAKNNEIWKRGHGL